MKVPFVPETTFFLNRKQLDFRPFPVNSSDEPFECDTGHSKNWICWKNQGNTWTLSVSNTDRRLIISYTLKPAGRESVWNEVTATLLRTLSWTHMKAQKISAWIRANMNGNNKWGSKINACGNFHSAAFWAIAYFSNHKIEDKLTLVVWEKAQQLQECTRLEWSGAELFSVGNKKIILNYILMQRFSIQNNPDKREWQNNSSYDQQNLEKLNKIDEQPKKLRNGQPQILESTSLWRFSLGRYPASPFPLL